MQTPFGVAQVWAQGDAVSRGVALLLLGMSVCSWVVILWKALQWRRQRAQAKASAAFWQAPDLHTGMQSLATEGNPFQHLALAAQAANQHLSDVQGQPRRLDDALDASEWVTRSLRNALDDCQAELQQGLGVLASIGSTAPFVGLFGTVWGIYHALLGIGAGGQASLDKVAGPIGEALVMTAFGLVVAIPAVLGYNTLLRAQKGILRQLDRFAHDLHAYWITGARVAGARTARPV